MRLENRIAISKQLRAAGAREDRIGNAVLTDFIAAQRCVNLSVSSAFVLTRHVHFYRLVTSKSIFSLRMAKTVLAPTPLYLFGDSLIMTEPVNLKEQLLIEPISLHTLAVEECVRHKDTRTLLFHFPSKLTTVLRTTN